MAECVYLEREAAHQRGELPDGTPVEPSTEDGQQRRSRQELETTGNAYGEVLRDGGNRVARLVYVPSYTTACRTISRPTTKSTSSATAKSGSS